MKPPQLLADLFQDLRDRRLLPVVLVLVGALVAAPILLSSDSEAPPPDVAAEEEAVDAPEARAAVVIEAERLRDYRTRLGDAKPRDPFEQQFLSRGSSASLEDSSTEEVGGGGSSTTSSSSASTETKETIETTIKLVSFKLDVLAGPVGDTREIKNVELLEFLPGEVKPVVQVLAVDSDGKKATFAVSSSVSGTSGDGRCLPDVSDCDFLRLKKGEDQRFDYELDGRTYRIKLLKIKQVLEETDIVIETTDSKGS